MITSPMRNDVYLTYARKEKVYVPKVIMTFDLNIDIWP